MPRYRYQCSECNEIQTVFLSITETLEDCPTCSSKNTMVKVYDKFFSKSETPKEQKVGTVTKEYIEKNRELLNQEKKEARRKEYEPSWINFKCDTNTVNSA